MATAGAHEYPAWDLAAKLVNRVARISALAKRADNLDVTNSITTITAEEHAALADVLTEHLVVESTETLRAARVLARQLCPRKEAA